MKTKNVAPLHITGLYALRRLRAAPGFRVARSVGLRPHSHATLHPQFVGPGNAAHFLIRAAKPSHIAGTLYAMGWGENISENICGKTTRETNRRKHG